MRRLGLLVLVPLVLASPAQFGRAGGGTPPGVLVFSSDRDGDGDIYTVHADGTHPRALTSTTKWEELDAVSPRGRTLVFRRYEPGFDRSALYAMRGDGTRIARIAEGGWRTAVSPDGTRVAYTWAGRLWIVRSDGSRRRRVSAGTDNWNPAWSPDGRRLAFARVRKRQVELVVLDVATRQERVLVRRLRLWYPAWSPDGREIAFIDGGGLRRADARTGTTHLVARGDNLFQFAWSPDGSRLAFTTAPRLNRYCGTTGFCVGLETLHVVRRDGTGHRRLAANTGAPAFSPDGRRIAFLRNNGPTNADLWVVDIDGRHQRQVTHRGTVAELFAWVEASAGRGRPVTEPAPHERLVGGELQSVARVIRVAASGSRVAVAVASARSECRHVLLWPSPERLVRVGTPAPCTPGFSSRLADFTFAGERAAWNETIEGIDVFAYLQTATVENPRPLTVAETVDEEQYDEFDPSMLAGIFADRGKVLVRDSRRVYTLVPGGALCQQATVRLCARLATLRNVELLDVHDGVFLLTHPGKNDLFLARPDGTVLAQPSPPIGSECGRPRLTSRWLVTVCEPSVVEVHDRLTGALVQRRGLPGLHWALEDVNDTFAVASDEKQLWVVRLADGSAAPVAIPPQTVPPHAALTTGGLVVSTYLPGARYPGRVQQMELPALEGARGGADLVRP